MLNKDAVLLCPSPNTWDTFNLLNIGKDIQQLGYESRDLTVRAVEESC